MSPERDSEKIDVIESQKDDVRETAASVPPGMEAAVGRKKMDIVPTLVPGGETVFPTICPDIFPTGPAPPPLLIGGSVGSGAELDSADSDLSVRSSVDDLVEARDRSN